MMLQAGVRRMEAKERATSAVKALQWMDYTCRGITGAECREVHLK